MPCFKGIGVSIHANGAPLPEYGVQKQSRVSRINSYIAVPQPQIVGESNKPEPAKFAISITLLTPGLAIPYSKPRHSDANPHPKPQYVGPLPSATTTTTTIDERGRYHGIVGPYIPMTNSENETIAAYIYFDGRAKEEVATLLRPGEETWVNSRWVQVPNGEGGGLAEREFLFREVGLERWLNGLDLHGHDAAERLERRRQKFEKRRRRTRVSAAAAAAAAAAPSADTDEDMIDKSDEQPRNNKRHGTLRYGNDEGAPVETLPENEDDESLSSSDDDDEWPESAGQIKVAMFRVIASGEIKKGEYSPQFDAHDDDDDDNGEANGGGKANGGGMGAEVEHTTSFAKPKTLDPKTISTQTVTGIDGPEKPYATFTFFYRGSRQLQKMGVMPSAKAQASSSTAAKRRSGQLDFSSLGPLKTSGTVGFSAFRDSTNSTSNDRHGASSSRKGKAHKHKSSGSMGGGIVAMDDSDDDDDNNDDDDEGGQSDDNLGRIEDIGAKYDKSGLGPEDAQFSGELAAGVDRIRLKRAHSVEPDSAVSSRKSPSLDPKSGNATPPLDAINGDATANNMINSSSSGGGGDGGGGVNATPGLPSSAGMFGKSFPEDGLIGSPLKKARPSIGGPEDLLSTSDGGGGGGGGAPGRPSGSSSNNFPPGLGDVLAKAEAAEAAKNRAQQLAAAMAGSPTTAPAVGGAAATAAATAAVATTPTAATPPTTIPPLSIVGEDSMEEEL